MKLENVKFQRIARTAGFIIRPNEARLLGLVLSEYYDLYLIPKKVSWHENNITSTQAVQERPKADNST